MHISNPKTHRNQISKINNNRQDGSELIISKQLNVVKINITASKSAEQAYQLPNPSRQSGHQPQKKKERSGPQFSFEGSVGSKSYCHGIKMRRTVHAPTSKRDQCRLVGSS